MMIRLLRAAIFLAFTLLMAVPMFAAGGACPTGNTIDPDGKPISLASLGITSCFYISKSTGADTNTGTTEATPWAHLPGMPSCTSTCSSTTPTAGEGFILRGGDTWVNADLGVHWAWSGTSSNPFYVGVDKTWFNAGCGASWCRPIWDAGLASITNGDMFQMINQSWLIVDNLEWKGMRNDGSGLRNAGGSNVRGTQLYIHGWGHTGTTDNVGFFSQGGAGSMADHNIIDGSDSTKNTFNGVFIQWSQFQYNYVSYVVSGVLGATDIVHDNVVEQTVTSVDGDHCNGIFTFDVLSGNTQLIYNNVIRHSSGCPGGVVLWFNGNGSPNSSIIGYGFGNTMYDLSSNPINIGNHGAGNYGTYYLFNNTIDCTVGGCGGPPGAGPTWTMYENNNHVIGSALDFCASGQTCNVCKNGTGAGCTDLTQSSLAAAAQGYTASEIYPYSPISTCTPITCSGVQKGTNIQSYCTALSSINAAAGAACQNSASVGCAYNIGNHTLSCPNSPAVARPSSAKWDIGAYQFAVQGPRPSPPSGLSYVIN